MYILDVLIVITAFLSLFILLNKDKMNMKFVLFFVILTLIIYFVHGFFISAKWQLFPLYLIVFILCGLGFITPKKRFTRAFIITISSLLTILTIALLYSFPISTIPKPRGIYEIGLRTYTIKDLDRLELYTEELNDTREFAFSMWYPASIDGSFKQAYWMDNDQVPVGLAKSVGLPSFVLSQITEVKAHAYLNAPISQEQTSYPLVIISHGWGGFMSLHTDLSEELASQGYIVVSIDHTYGSVSTKLSDKTVFQNLEALPDRSEDDFLEKANQLVYTYAYDVIKTLDYLEEQNALTSNAFFKGKIDFDHIGLIGHSTGGGADVAAALNDDRITALIGLDAWVEPILEADILEALSIPSLYLRSETWEDGENNDHLYKLITNSENARLYQISGTTHSDFTMAYMLSPLMPLIGYTGSLDSDYLVDMQKDIIQLFFDEHLKGEMNEAIDLTFYNELIEIQMD